jgi:hypothetical protein
MRTPSAPRAPRAVLAAPRALRAPATPPTAPWIEVVLCDSFHEMAQQNPPPIWFDEHGVTHYWPPRYSADGYEMVGLMPRDHRPSGCLNFGLVDGHLAAGESSAADASLYVDASDTIRRWAIEERLVHASMMLPRWALDGPQKSADKLAPTEDQPSLEDLRQIVDRQCDIVKQSRETAAESPQDGNSARSSTITGSDGSTGACPPRSLR